MKEENIFAITDNIFATTQINFVISKNIFVQTVQNIISDGSKISFGRFEI